MDTQYRQIKDFSLSSAKKRENSSYLEDLTGLLASVSSSIDNGTKYCFGNEYYLDNQQIEQNSNFSNFIVDLKNSFFNGSSDKIYIIRGRAGIGKTLFFERGMQKLIKVENKKNAKYISMRVDFRNIDNDKKVKFYKKEIYEQLRENAIDNIGYLGNNISDEFWKEYDNLRKDVDTPNMKLFPLKFFCEKIYRKYNRPCIIVFDNIDLSSVKTQKNVFKATVNICNAFNSYMRATNSSKVYRVYFVMRPETYLYSEEAKLGDVINFPLPNVLRICLEVIEGIITEKAKEFDEVRKLSCNITCYDILRDDDEDTMITFTSYLNVANYFIIVLNEYLGKIWREDSTIYERLGSNEEFHCNIVNCNVRKFMQYLADTISNGGFEPLTKDFNRTRRYYNVYDYVEMLIRGSWDVHPGNKYMVGEGGNKGPIVFNVFDISLYKNNQEDRVRHFMLNIRILQYFYLYADGLEITYEDLRKNLDKIFDKKHILNATKKLTHIYMLYSFSEGDDAIASIQDWKKVKIEDSTKLSLSPCGRFYIERFIYEFEYLYQMALSSLINVEYFAEISRCWKTEKELTVLCFLKSMYGIIKENISSYNQEGIEILKLLFYNVDSSNGCRPFRKMIRSFVSVMTKKVQRARKRKITNINKLTKILENAKCLENEVKEYFSLTLGE